MYYKYNKYVSCVCIKPRYGDCTLSIMHHAGVLPTQVAGITPTPFSLAIMNTTTVSQPDEAVTVAKVLQHQLVQVRGSASLDCEFHDGSLV